jgi:hypothetical protein
MIPFSTSWPQELLRSILQMDTKQLLELMDLQPAIVLEADRREWAPHKREFHFGGTLSQAAVAAQLSSVGIRVPVTVDEVAVVYFMKNTSVVTGDLILGDLGVLTVVPGEIAANPATAVLDSRNVERTGLGTTLLSSAALTWRAASAGGIGAGVFTLHESLAAGERLTKEQHGYIAVLGPGGFLGIQTQAVNLAMSANWWFYERATRAGGRVIV